MGRYVKEVQSRLNIWTNPQWTQDEYLLVYENGGYIEPEFGWGVSLNKKLIYPSLGFAYAPYVHKPELREYYSKKQEIHFIDRIISLRDTGEENYFHFFNDILAKLFFLLEQGIPVDHYTLVISESLFKKEYFQFYYKIWKDTFTWYVQSTAWVHFRWAVFCKPYTHTMRFLQKSVDLIPAGNRNSAENRRIFLTRNRSSLRFIENEDEIINIVTAYGFEKVDASELPFLKQVALFSKTSHLIAVHGAGITNILFRSAPMSILEIHHASEYVPFHYIMLASLLGFDHQIVLGSSQESNGGFRVEPETISSYLQQVKFPNNR